MRLLFAAVIGSLITLAIFYLMPLLISTGKKTTLQSEQENFVDFIRRKDDELTKTRERKSPAPPPDKQEPSRPKTEVSKNPPTKDNPLNIPPSALALGKSGNLNLFMQGNHNQINDGELLPIVRIQPRMPRRAAMKGIEGYVTLKFKVTKTGTTKDIKIIESKPPRIFDRAAKKAISKWKYKPQVVDGKRLEIEQFIRLNFNLEKTK